MADTNTTYLGLIKPEPDGSQHTWGDKLNQNFDTIDALFPSQILPVAKGGTGATNAANARANLGVGSLALQNASSVSVGALIVSTAMGVGTSPSVECDVAGSAKATNGTFGTITGVNATLTGSASMPTLSVTNNLTVSKSSFVKENARPVFSAYSIYQTNTTDVQVSSGTVMNPQWATEVADTVGSSIGTSAQYIEQLPQGLYLVAFHIPLYGQSFVNVGGQVSVNDTYAYVSHPAFINASFGSAVDAIWAYSAVLHLPSSSNNIKLVFWNYSGYTVTLKYSSSIGCKLYIVRVG